MQNSGKDLVLGTLAQLKLDHGVANGETFFDMSARLPVLRRLS